MEIVNRKITKIGNSYGITIPLEILEEVGLKQGDEVQLELNNGVIQISKSRQVTLPQGISEDFFDIVKETMETYDQTLKGLVDR